jgi:hypothetical protein
MSTNRYLGVDPVLTNVALGYTNDQMIASAIFPEVPVAKQSGKHFVYGKDRFRINENKRGTGSQANEVTLSLTTGNPYFCEDHALKMFVPDEDVENAETPTTPLQDATEFLMDQHLVSFEKEVADLITSTANLTNNTTLSGTDQWSDYSNSDPFGDFETAKATIHSTIGVDPNTAIISKQVWDKIKHHPDFLERVKYSQRGQITVDLLASLIEVDRVLIGGAYYNTAKEGQADSTAYVWGKDVVLAYVAPRVAPKIMTLGINYKWTAKQLQTKRMRGVAEDDREGTYVRVGGWYYDVNVVAPGAGFLLKSCVA